VIAALGMAPLAAPTQAGAATLGTVGSAVASCPADCLVEARVTGFQTSIGSKRKLVRTPARGRIVSWSIDLGMPRRTDIKGFNRKFGESKARLAVLKKVRTRTGSRRLVRYVLLRQSPVQRLRSHFGQTISFPLERPLKVGAGQVLALTIPTWAPAFAVDGSEGSRWLASRKPTQRGGCVTRDGQANITAGSAHQRPRSVRTYRCGYHGTRLLYSATFVKAGTQP
jgi:hypothetical protein